MMKRTVIMAVVLCLALGASASAYTLTPNGDFPVVDEPVVLDVWSAAPTSIIDMATNEMTLWYEEYTGVHVNWTLATEEAATKMNLSLASGDYPDIYFNSFTSAQVMLNANAGVFIPLNDLIENNSHFYKRVLESEPVIKENITAPDGNIYTFFRNDAAVHMLSQNKMFVYQPWLERLGLSMPATTEEYKAMLVAFRDQDPNGNGQQDEIPLVGAYNEWGGDPIAFLMNPFQLWHSDYLLGQNDTVTFVANTDGFRDGLRYVNGLFEEGLLAEETYVQDGTQLKTLINHPAEDQMLVGCYPSAHAAAFIDLTMLPEGLIDFTPVPPLEGPTGLRQAEAGGESRIALYGAITSACKTPDVAMRWVDGLIGGEGRDRSYYGTEGNQFSWSDEPAISGAIPSRTLTFEYMAPDNTWWHNYGIGPVYDTADYRYSETNVYGWYGWAHYRAHDAYKDFYVGVGFPIVSWSTDEEIAAEISELKILIEEYVEQSCTQFILGVKDVDDDAAWNGYKAELENMGLARYIELNQTVNFG